MQPSDTQSPEKCFSEAKWIWPDNRQWDIHNSYALFRKTFVLDTLPVRAPLFVTADQSYQLYVNGEYAGRGPARGFQSHWPYDEVEILSSLRPGKNVIAVRAHNPGFSNFQYVTQGWAGLLVAADWDGIKIVSDQTWKSRRQTGINRSAIPTSIQLFCQEHIDLRMEDPAWAQPDFDDGEWTERVSAHHWNGMPWSGLEARDIPRLEEILGPPARGIGRASGRCAEGYLHTRDVTLTRHAEGLSHEPWESTGERIAVSAAGSGGWTSYLLDYGRTVVGSTGFAVSGANGGEIIDTFHVETIAPGTLTPDYQTVTNSKMAFGHRLVCRAGDQEHTFYHPFGFRYLVVTVRDNARELTIRPHLRTTLYPFEQRGSFQSSDPALQAIWETCVWTQRVCSLDAYVDTPWREQAQWWGDARVQAKNTFFFSGDTRLFRRGLAQIAAQTTATGLTYGHSPTRAHECILPDFTLIWIITLWDYYWQTGSLEPFLAHQETIRNALTYFEEKTDAATGLVGYDPRYWLFLDWTGLFKDGYSTVYNLWLLIALDRLTDMYRVANDESEVQRLAAWSARMRAAFDKLTREDGILYDGLTFAGEIFRETSVHAQTLAIIAGLRKEHDDARLEKVLLPFIRGQEQPKAPPSCYWITYVFEVLTEAGHGDAIIEFIEQKWTPMAAHGTTWEEFAPRRGYQSFSHAWSAHPLYHLMQTVGGIRQTMPAWQEIVFRPCFRGDRAEVVVPTPHGQIRSAWWREGAAVAVELDLPAGISATAILPGAEPVIVHGTGRWRC